MTAQPQRNDNDELRALRAEVRSLAWLRPLVVVLAVVLAVLSVVSVRTALIGQAWSSDLEERVSYLEEGSLVWAAWSDWLFEREHGLSRAAVNGAGSLGGQ